MKLPKYKLIYDRRHIATPTKVSAVELVISYNYKQKFISTGMQLLPQHWNASLCKVMKCEDALVKNEMLKSFMDKAEKIIFDMVREDRVDLDLFARMMGNKDDGNAPTFFNYVHTRVCAKAVRDSTKKRYRSFVNVLKEYRQELSFAEITVKFIRDYDEWLHKRNIGDDDAPKKMAQSSIATHHKHMKQFINDAIVDGYMKTNPYHDRAIKIDRGDKEYVDYLTEAQLHKMQKLPLSTGYLIKARDLFILQSYTGLSYADLMEFDMGKATKVESGQYMYIGHRHKTGVEFILFLLPEALKVLKKYDNVVPQITNQKYNEYLKVIGAMIGVPGLHTHQARGTFATIAINRGVSLDILKRVLGHIKAIQTCRYATILHDTVEKEMNKLK